MADPELEDAAPDAPMPETPSAAAHRLELYQDCVIPRPECDRRLTELSGGVANLAKTVSRLERAMVEMATKTEERLNTGTKSFENIRTDIAETKGEIKALAAATAPKKVDVMKTISFVVGIVLSIVAAVWLLAVSFGERPTSAQMNSAISDHANNGGHPAMTQEIRAIRDQQTALGTQISIIGQKLDDTKVDLKDLKDDIKVLAGSRLANVPAPPHTTP